MDQCWSCVPLAMADHGAVMVIKSKAEWDSALDKATKEGRAVVVDFTATWCPPCRMIGPVFTKLSKVFPSLTFLKVDVDGVADVAAECEISAMPTFKVFKDRAGVDELVGASPRELEALIKKYA